MHGCHSAPSAAVEFIIDPRSTGSPQSLFFVSRFVNHSPCDLYSSERDESKKSERPSDDILGPPSQTVLLTVNPRKAGVPTAMISHFETGVQPNASAATLVKLAEALRVSIDYLIGRTDDESVVDDRVLYLFRQLSSASDDIIEISSEFIDQMLKMDKAQRED